MTSSPHDTALARSILACCTDASLTVDDFPAAGEDDDLGLRDVDGVPTFSCRSWSLLAHAAAAGSEALVVLSSGLGTEDGPDRGHSLTLTGRLRAGVVEDCHCCGERRHDVHLRLGLVVLTRASGEQVTIPLRAFLDPGLRLNRGHLQRAAEHANDCHRENLVEVVLQRTRTSREELLDARMTALTTRGADLAWIDLEGAHQAHVPFSREARTIEELALLIRHELHTGIC